ncbi:MAG TPA: glycosyltransferase family 39 protein [Candidatus Baltobacteraceae bacterium]|jgi:4-amino-4-deoxy-L-arabinose transferase-like glycosyltransferase|nr:glycosyltransferase family 39 protein [Candidatus Baltobacteraceae bacterium]
MDLIAWMVAAAVFLSHALVAGRYDAFRNELYFIVCGRHPALGYVDQPPLVPLMAALTQTTGDRVWLLRLPAALCAALLVPVTVSLARLLGAGTRGAWLAAIAAASAPMLIGITSTLTTSTFEPLSWTVVSYLVVRALVRDERRMLIWAGIVAGLAFEAKYGVVIWLIALALGVASTSARRLFLMPAELWIGAACVAALALPNVLWQAAHHLPFLEVMRNNNAGNLTGSPIGFALGQIFAMNLLLAPLWLAGVVSPFVRGDLARFRFLSVAFVTAAILVFATHGKSYYLAGAYPSMFALGAAACTGSARALVAGWMILAIGNAALALPLVSPVLEPDALARYLARAAVRPSPVEVAGIGAPLTQVFSDEFGWRELEQTVARVYDALPPSERRNAAILASNYGEAAALDVYGAVDHLPPALSEQDQYFLWGTHGYDGSIVIVVNADRARWERICNRSRVVARFGVPYAMPYERDRTIVLCHGTRVPLPLAWPRFKHFGL